MGPSLYGGFAGVAWAVAHLQPETSTEEIDEALKDHVNRPRWRGDYDLIGGLVGLGIYALERLPSPAAVSCLEGVIDRLEETAQRRGSGISWRTAPRLLPPQQLKENPRGYDNLGLAHGVAGVIGLLGAASAAGIRRRRARQLLDRAVCGLLAAKLAKSAGASFPGWITPGVKPQPCRSAWCYGDPGVAAALFCAARCTGEKQWEHEALEIARAAAQRPSEEAGVVDAGLCHGAAGLGHIFNRMYQETADSTLKRAARFWLEQTLALRQRGRGIGGFRALAAREDGARYWNDDPGILTGAAGIGLTLLAAATPVAPDWDRMLLLSTNPRRPQPIPQ